MHDACRFHFASLFFEQGAGSQMRRGQRAWQMAAAEAGQLRGQFGIQRGDRQRILAVQQADRDAGQDAAGIAYRHDTMALNYFG